MTNPRTIMMRIDNDLRLTPDREWSTATLNERNALWNKTRTEMERLDTKYQAIMANRSLSTEGQRTAVAALATEFISAFAFLERVVSRLDEKFANTTLFTVKPVITESVVREIRNKELRDGLRGLNHAERDVQFLHAAEQDQDEVLDAMLDAPGGMLITPDMKRRALEARAKRLRPEAFAQWEQDTLYRGLVNGLREHCVLCLISMGADPKKVMKELGAMTDLAESAAPKKMAEVVLGPTSTLVESPV